MLGLAGNLGHPQADDLGDTLAQIQLVADSEIWVLDHLGIMLGVVLVTVFVFAIARTISGALAAEVARLGLGLQLVAAATIVVLVGIDGIASKDIFDEWAASTGNEREIWTQIAIATEEIDFGIFITFMITQYGLVFMVLGTALWLSDNYDSLFGIAAIALGVFGAVMGGIWAFASVGDLSATLAFAAILTLLLWVVTMGVLMLRTTPLQPTDDAPTPDQRLTANVE